VSESSSGVTDDAAFAREVRANQARLRSGLESEYDFIVCGAGTSGSVVARRLAENPAVRVLLLEAGGDDDVPDVMDPGLWPTNIGTARDWGFLGEPDPGLDGRRLLMSMGKVLGGGSSINAMAWSRGHASDWDLFATEAEDKWWSYSSVLNTYRRVEDWQGSDPLFRGTGGEVHIEPASDPHPVALAMLEAARGLGIPSYENPNGRMMEGDKGAAIGDLLIRDGRRRSVFRCYAYPYLDRSNLTVLTDAVVLRVDIQRKRAVAVEFAHQGQVRRIAAGAEVILSLGALNTPKVLMLSGLGDESHLRQVGVPVLQHIPGMGRNMQDHTAFDCVWEFPEGALPPRRNGSEVVLFANELAEEAAPDIFVWQAETPLSTPENTAIFGLPVRGWTLFSAIAHPKSRGQVRLSGSDPRAPLRIVTNALSHPDDLRVGLACISLCRSIGNSDAMRGFVQREVMPGGLAGAELETYVRRAARTFWHVSGTAKMGRDELSVVNGKLQVYGIEGLRVADASIMPRVSTGNTMAPCVIIGERAADDLKSTHHL
jgi:choline dehydrogenase